MLALRLGKNQFKIKKWLDLQRWDGGEDFYCQTVVIMSHAQKPLNLILQ